METRRYLRRNNTLSSRNALIDDGLEVVPIDSGLESSPAEYHLATCGPQAVIGDEQKEVYPHHEDRPSRTCEPVGGMLSKRSWIWFTIIVTLIIIAVVLAVAIPLTRNRHNSR